MKAQRFNWPVVWSLVVAGLIAWGSRAHLERYITPQRGLGYWLGIIGASMMVLLLIYSARKRFSYLRWLGGIPSWFRIHMVLGVVGPVLVLFHANFRLGATNSNVALICMLVVAGSGVIGRYIYTRLHAHLDGNEETLEQLKATGERMRSQSSSISFMPGLLDAIVEVEYRLIAVPEGTTRRFFYLLTGAPRSALARWRVHREIEEAMNKAIKEAPLIARHAHRIAAIAGGYADRRLEASRRVAEYQAYERLFSFWHLLHVPLFFMLLIAGIVHVVAINVY